MSCGRTAVRTSCRALSESPLLAHPYVSASSLRCLAEQRVEDPACKPRGPERMRKPVVFRSLVHHVIQAKLTEVSQPLERLTINDGLVYRANPDVVVNRLPKHVVVVTSRSISTLAIRRHDLERNMCSAILDNRPVKCQYCECVCHPPPIAGHEAWDPPATAPGAAWSTRGHVRQKCRAACRDIVEVQAPALARVKMGI